MTTVQNFIGGELVDSVSGATMPLVDPSTGEEYGTAPISNEKDIDNAYAAAPRRSKTGSARRRRTGRRRCSTSPTTSRRTRRGARRGRGPQHGQAQPRHHGRRDPADGRPDPVLRRRRTGAGGQVGGRVHGEPHVVDPPRAGRRHRAGLALELPDDDGDLEVLSGDRRGQHRRDQAERHHAGDDGDARRVRGQALSARRAQCRHRRPGTGAAVVAHPTPEMVSITGSVAAGRAVAVSAGGNLKRTHLELGGKAP